MDQNALRSELKKPELPQAVLVYCTWSHMDTEEQIAIKQCRQELSLRNRERWCLEIQIMKKHTKLKQKQEDDIVVYEDLSGEVKFSKHLPYPNNLNRFLLEKMECWLQTMLKWNPQKRGTDPTYGPNGCFKALDDILGLKLVHVLNMVSAEIHTFPVTDRTSVPELQEQIAIETHIEPANQELLLEAGLPLDPQKEAAECAVDYKLIDGRRTDMPLVFLFDRSKSSYEPQFSQRPMPDNIKFVQTDPEKVLPYSPLRRTWSQAWHTTRTLKEDWQRVQQGQKAAL
ncbi:UNVERIFIED_CONTAM: hypothetical protein FKN15_002818 [Acipenser sinensis]